MLWLKVSHAVRMGKQLSKCERNPREYSHTQNVSTMKNNPGAERLSECSLIEDTMLCEQGRASSLQNNKKLKSGLTGLLLKGEHKPQPVCVSNVNNCKISSCLIESNKLPTITKLTLWKKGLCSSTQPYCSTICFGHSGEPRLKTDSRKGTCCDRQVLASLITEIMKVKALAMFTCAKFLQNVKNITHGC